jgi:hypothetical protein
MLVLYISRKCVFVFCYAHKSGWGFLKCVSVTPVKVRIIRYLTEAFSIQNDLQEADTLLPWILEHYVWKCKKTEWIKTVHDSTASGLR